MPRHAVARGFKDRVIETTFATLPLAVRVLILPDLRQAVPILPAALRFRAGYLANLWNGARRVLLARLRQTGLESIVDSVNDAWDSAVNEALTRYEEVHGTPHPVRHSGLM